MSLPASLPTQIYHRTSAVCEGSAAALSFSVKPRFETRRHWWHSPKRQDRNSFFLRYGFAVFVIGFAALLSFRLPAMQDTPFMLFFGAVVISAVYGGVGPAMFTLAGSFLVLSYLFVPEYFRFSFTRDIEETVRMLVFLLVSGICAAFVAGCRRSQASRQENEDRFQILVNMAADAIVVLDHRCNMIFANPATERLFGHPAETLIGQSFTKLLPHDDHHPTIEQLRKRLDTRKAMQASDYLARHRDGHTIQVEITFGTLTYHGKPLYTAIIRDVSSRRSLTA